MTTTTPIRPALLSIPEAAGYIGLGRSKTYELVQAGEIPVVRIGEFRRYQELLISPVTSPCSARLRRQMRHILNLRRNARGRPQSGQRL